MAALYLARIRVLPVSTLHCVDFRVASALSFLTREPINFGNGVVTNI